MSKNRMTLLIVAITVVAVCIIYYIYFTKPDVFLDEQQIIDEVNAFDYPIKIRTIEERLKLDDYNYFVPFITDDGQPGASYYRWEMAEWRLITFEKNETAKVWQLDDKDPSTKFIVWHHPKDTVDYIELYLMKDRSYIISENKHHYEPKIQLVEQIELARNFGALKVSADFATVMQVLNLSRFNQVDLFGISSSHKSYYLGMNLFKDNEELQPTTTGSYRYWTGNVELKFDFLFHVNESQLE